MTGSEVPNGTIQTDTPAALDGVLLDTCMPAYVHGFLIMWRRSTCFVPRHVHGEDKLWLAWDVMWCGVGFLPNGRERNKTVEPHDQHGAL